MEQMVLGLGCCRGAVKFFVECLNCSLKLLVVSVS